MICLSKQIKVLLILVTLICIHYKTLSQNEVNTRLVNKTFQVDVSIDAGIVDIKIKDLEQNIVWADGTYQYELSEMINGQLKVFSSLELPRLESQPDRIRIRGLIGGFEIEHDLLLAAESPFLAEEMRIVNCKGERRNVKYFHTAFSKKITDKDGNIINDIINDHFQGVPFLHRSDYKKTPQGLPDNDSMDYTIGQLMEGNGFVFQTSEYTWEDPRRLPSRRFISEGWAWRHGKTTLGIFSFNQDNMIFSSLSCDDDGLLHFGGFLKEGLNLSAMESFGPHSTINLGLNRFYPISGSYNQVAYKYRGMLDEMGCHFPAHYNPPVQWNELYNIGGDHKFYTIENLRKEAQKAIEHSCQALYLDPGWDTKFGSFLWDSARLGNFKDYVTRIENEYGLKTSLHTPMPPWTSNSNSDISDWPGASRRLIHVKDSLTSADKIVPAKKGPQICMGSKQFQDEAEQRLLTLCQAGVSFLMFDGTWWNGPCEDPNHGHPIPYLYEDHIDACVEMARRVHLKYPNVLIEMHDMMNGGHWTRSTPVYYKYGLPGSYDENWGFELMWEPFKHLKDKTALAMYYYNLGCNVPIYLHINLGHDNINNIVLWWYASTARHLGIGGDCTDSLITKEHHKNMKIYLQFQDFFKRGDFYGINPEIHIHTLPEKKECVINIFNLNDSASVTKGSVGLEEIGLDPSLNYRANKNWISINKGKITVAKEMKPWDADIATIKPN